MVAASCLRRSKKTGVDAPRLFGNPPPGMDPTGASSGSPIGTVVVLAALSLLPFVFMTTTSFVKVSVVFSILRNALGTGQVPSGTVVTALAAILSLYVMTPVASVMWERTSPILTGASLDGALGDVDRWLAAWDAAKAPLEDFLHRNAGARELASFVELARESRPEDQRAAVTDHDLTIVVPAFLVTELGEAFQIGFLVFLPFLIVDVVVANVLLALGMHMLNPTQVSMPFKLLLFVLVDGWYVLARALVLGYA